MLARVLDITAPRIHGGDVIARGRIVGTGGDATRVGLNREIAEAYRVGPLAAGVMHRADLLMQLDHRSFAQGVVARIHPLQLAAELGERRIVVTTQVVHVAQARVRADDQQPFGTRHRPLLKLDRLTRRFFRCVEVAAERFKH
jgi:hypothetical protein